MEERKLIWKIIGNGKSFFDKAGETVKVKVSDDYSYELVIRKIEDTTDDEEDKIRAF